MYYRLRLAQIAIACGFVWPQNTSATAVESDDKHARDCTTATWKIDGHTPNGHLPNFT